MLAEFGSLPELVLRSLQASVFRITTGKPAQVEREVIWSDEGEYSKVVEVHWKVHEGPPPHEAPPKGP